MTDQLALQADGRAAPAAATTTGASRQALAAVAVTKASRSAFFVLLTALVAYQFKTSYGLAAADTQFLVSLASFAGLLRPLLGYWGDVRPLGAYRRKNLMSLGNVAFLAAITLMLAFPNPMLSAGYATILVAFVVYGFGEACIDVGTDSLLLDVATTPADKNRVQGHARLGAVAGTMLAYGLAIGLAGPGYPWLLAAIAATIVAGTALTLRIPEAPVTRGQVLEQVAREQPTIPAGYKANLWIAGIAFALVPLAEGLVNVQLEPWLIGRYGDLPDIFYAVELATAAIGIAALAGLLAVQRRHPLNISAFLVPAGAVAALYYVALPWLAPDIGAYAAWNTAKGVAGVITVLATERIFMDVVRGARKGATFQLFVLFFMGGSVAGQVLGAALSAIGMEALLAIAGGTFAAAVILYAAVLAPRLKEA